MTIRTLKPRSIRSRISLWVGACALVTALVIISFAAISVQTNAIDAAMKEAVALARSQATAIEHEIEVALGAARTLAQALSAVKDENVRLDIDRKKALDILSIVITRNPKFVGIHTCWEHGGFDGLGEGYAGKKTHDRIARFAAYRRHDAAGAGRIGLLARSLGSAGGMPAEWYAIAKKRKRECIIDPFEHTAGGKETVSTTVVAPIMAGGQFHGVVGIDMQLDFLQTMADNLDVYDKTGTMMVISNNGTLACVTGRPDMVGGHMSTARTDYEGDLALIQKGGQAAGFTEGNLQIFTPVNIGNTNTPWSVNILVPKDKVFAGAHKLMWKMLMIGIVCAGGAVALLWFIAAGIVRPIESATDMVKEIAEGEGDLAARLEVRSEDETGELAKWFNVFMDKFEGIIEDISVTTSMLNVSSSELSILSGQMASFAEEVTSQSHAVAGATDEVSANINAMASATEQMSVSIQSVSSTAGQMSENMSSVATSMEEMSVAIREVSGSAQEGSDIAGKAMEMSASATDTMNVLASVAREIGKVTDLIKRIAGKTNLLALNATIEAASAGEAGKGFAVVANEIKALANQSGHAAEDIARRIQGIQANTEGAVKVISSISAIINKVNESSMLITKSVEQQTITANEISGSIQHASSGAGNIATSIAEIAKGANDVAKGTAESVKGVSEVSLNIRGVCDVSSASDAGAQRVSISADKLARMAAHLQEMLGRFKVETP